MLWFGDQEQPEGIPSDLGDTATVVDRLAEKYGIATTVLIFDFLTLWNWGPTHWTIDGKKMFCLSQVDAWVEGWTYRPKIISPRFREPKRRRREDD